jgi:hypothetical protein
MGIGWPWSGFGMGRDELGCRSNWNVQLYCVELLGLVPRRILVLIGSVYIGVRKYEQTSGEEFGRNVVAG